TFPARRSPTKRSPIDEMNFFMTIEFNGWLIVSNLMENHFGLAVINKDLTGCSQDSPRYIKMNAAFIG
ncbi:MAG TPA: hypothetical protein PK610_09035, partial [Flavobacteriales bacterium]|nr:hypothetical protein [Flavobacteriales bacterium]